MNTTNPHYDYHQDEEIFRAAEKYDKVCGGKSYDDLVNDPDSVPVLFYDVEVLAECFSTPTCISDIPLLEGLQYFAFGINTLFSNYYTMEYKAPDDMEYAAKGLIMTLFGRYSEKLEQYCGESFDDVSLWVRKWRDVTLDIIREVFEGCPESAGIIGGHLDNRRIVRQTMWMTETVCSEFLESRKYGNLQYAAGIVPYNFWGYKYDEQSASVIKEISPKEEEGAVNDVLNNKLYLAHRYQSAMERIVEVAGNIDKSNEVIADVCNEFKVLFFEYTKLLRLRSLYSYKVLTAAALHWKDITCTSIDVETYLYGQTFRLADYCPGDIIHSDVFRSSEHQKWDAIRALGAQLLCEVKADVQIYVDGLKTGPETYEWTPGLEKLKIKYLKLFEAMRQLHFLDSSLSFDVFCDGIQRADVSDIQKAIIDPTRNASALRYLVRTIGHEVESWYAAAAATLKDSQGRPYTRDKVDKVSNVTEAIASMSEVLPRVMKLTGK